MSKVLMGNIWRKTAEEKQMERTTVRQQPRSEILTFQSFHPDSPWSYFKNKNTSF